MKVNLSPGYKRSVIAEEIDIRVRWYVKAYILFEMDRSESRTRRAPTVYGLKCGDCGEGYKEWGSCM